MKQLRKKAGHLLGCLGLLMGIFMVVLFLPSFCMAQEQITQHIYDHAGYFSTEEAEELEELCLEYGEAADANIVLLIEDGVKNKKWKEFLEDFYDENEDALGDAALLLLDINKEERRIEMQGYGEMEYYISDSRIDDMIAKMLPDLKSGDYYTALSSFPVMVKDYYDSGYGEDARQHTEADNENYDPYYYEKEEENPLLTSMLIAFPISLVVAGVGTFLMAHRAGGADTTTFHSYMNESRQNLIGRYDRYTHTTTSKRRKPQENHNSGGGGGGGGVSSGGNSHSGGGSSF